MKFLPSQLTYFLSQRESRRNLTALAKFSAVLGAIIVSFAVLFHLIMVHVEGQSHSWLTGLYWTLTVMSTLGFGDITFETDLGRAFSLVVLVTGVVMLLIVLPFTFIRFFYAPWLEAQIRLRAPRELAPEVEDHVVLCRHDDVARLFIRRLAVHGIPYVVLEPDFAVAASLAAEGVSVVAGDIDSTQTYRDVRVRAARMVVANLDDATNTNVTLTVREESLDVPIMSIVEDNDAVDILELAGANHVVALKHRLGEQLASRVAHGPIRSHVIGRYGDLYIAEFAAQNTGLVGRTIRETRLRELTGLTVVGHWERGHLLSATPDTVLSSQSVAVIVGTMDQITTLDAMFVIYDDNTHPVVVIGGGKVGRAAIRALRARDVGVHVVERDPALRERLEAIADRVIIGDAADRTVLERAGLDAAPSVLLSANDDAVNIYLAVYCRKLNPALRIVSRITHERNLEAIHRAGADFVLSYTTLGVKYLVSLMLGRELVILGENVDVFVVPVPEVLRDKTLAESGIGAHTGLSVIGLQEEGHLTTELGPDTRLGEGAELVMFGSGEQRALFGEHFSAKRKH
jgi:voltage-gated potassium channel